MTDPTRCTTCDTPLEPLADLPECQACMEDGPPKCDGCGEVLPDRTERWCQPCVDKMRDGQSWGMFDDYDEKAGEPVGKAKARREATVSLARDIYAATVVRYAIGPEGGKANARAAIALSKAFWAEVEKGEK